MATRKKVSRRKNSKPSPAQLRARRAFVEMAKARAKLARSNKAKGKPKKRRNTATPDSQHTQAVRKYYRSGGENQWQRAARLGQRDLFSHGIKRRSNTKGRKAARPKVNRHLSAFNRVVTHLSNPGAEYPALHFVQLGLKAGKTPGQLAGLLRKRGLTASATKSLIAAAQKGAAVSRGRKSRRNPDPIDRVYEEFMGHAPTEEFEIDVPETPRRLAAMGEIESITYAATKPHIDGGHVTRYTHDFGEDGGVPPLLAQNEDHDLFFIGGDYTVTERGIEG